MNLLELLRLIRLHEGTRRTELLLRAEVEQIEARAYRSVPEDAVRRIGRLVASGDLVEVVAPLGGRVLLPGPGGGVRAYLAPAPYDGRSLLVVNRRSIEVPGPPRVHLVTQERLSEARVWLRAEANRLRDVRLL
ncbi:hypothetical protein [Kitasatospora cineracea]|uniref:hypothetical protein n=1 Tax=Kitasatospora cineracea TaxID=88074 RepID=UPI0033E8BA25